MPWQAVPGSSLLIPSGPQGKHLHVVLLGPVVIAGMGAKPHLVFASVTTLRADLPHDPTCIISAGEHPFVTRESYVFYRKLRVDDIEHVQARVAEHVWTEHAPCSDALLARILAGVGESRAVSGEFRKLFGHA